MRGLNSGRRTRLNSFLKLGSSQQFMTPQDLVSLLSLHFGLRCPAEMAHFGGDGVKLKLNFAYFEKKASWIPLDHDMA